MPDRTVPGPDHGCAECRDLFGWESIDQREVPAQLEPAGAVLRDAGDWAGPFHRCRDCRSWWSLSFNPKDMLYVQTPVGPALERALRRNAPLDAAWPFLFARAPIDEQFERYLWAGHYDPVRCLDRLLTALREPGAPMLRQTDVLRMLARLLSLYNPEHADLRARQGWVWPTPTRRAFVVPLLAFEERLRNCDAWAGYATYAQSNLADIRGVLDRSRSGKRRIFEGATPDLP